MRERFAGLASRTVPSRARRSRGGAATSACLTSHPSPFPRYAKGGTSFLGGRHWRAPATLLRAATTAHTCHGSMVAGASRYPPDRRRPGGTGVIPSKPFPAVISNSPLLAASRRISASSSRRLCHSAVRKRCASYALRVRAVSRAAPWRLSSCEMLLAGWAMREMADDAWGPGRRASAASRRVRRRYLAIFSVAHTAYRPR